MYIDARRVFQFLKEIGEMIKFCNTVPDVRNNSFNDYEAFKDKVNYSMMRALYSGQLSNFGVLYRELCDSFSAYLNLHGGRDVVVTSSGHTALMAAFSCLGVKKLLVPCYTFESTRVAATELGIEVNILDVSDYDGSFSPEALRDVDRDSYDAVVVVAPLSSIPNLEMFSGFCKRHGKKLIIDGAATFGTKGIHNYGDMFCMSLHATKPFPMGEGGLVICNSDQTAAVERYITFGLDRYKLPLGRGINAKISEYSCAVGLGLFEIIDKHIQARKENAIYLKNSIMSALGDRVKFIASWAGNSTVYQSLPVYIDRSSELIRYLAKNDIQTIKYYKPLMYSSSGKYDGALNLYNKNVCLPVHSGLSLDDLDYMVDKISEFYNA